METLDGFDLEFDIFDQMIIDCSKGYLSRNNVLLKMTDPKKKFKFERLSTKQKFTFCNILYVNLKK